MTAPTGDAAFYDRIALRFGGYSSGVRLMLGYAVDVLGVRHFVAYIEPDNLGSRGVARRLGFAERGLDTTGDRPMPRYELTCGRAEAPPS